MLQCQNSKRHARWHRCGCRRRCRLACTRTFTTWRRSRHVYRCHLVAPPACCGDDLTGLQRSRMCRLIAAWHYGSNDHVFMRMCRLVARVSLCTPPGKAYRKVCGSKSIWRLGSTVRGACPELACVRSCLRRSVRKRPPWGALMLQWRPVTIQITNQNGATSGFETCFAPSTFVSNPA